MARIFCGNGLTKSTVKKAAYICTPGGTAEGIFQVMVAVPAASKTPRLFCKLIVAGLNNVARKSLSGVRGMMRPSGRVIGGDEESANAKIYPLFGLRESAI